MIDETGGRDKAERISEISKELEVFLENAVKPEFLKSLSGTTTAETRGDSIYELFLNVA